MNDQVVNERDAGPANAQGRFGRRALEQLFTANGAPEDSGK